MDSPSVVHRGLVASVFSALAVALAAPPAHAQSRATPPAPAAADDDVEITVSAPRPTITPEGGSTQPPGTSPARVNPPETPTAAAGGDELRALRETVARLEARIGQLEAAPAPRATPTATPAASPPASAPAPPSLVSISSVRADNALVLPPMGIVLSGYVQAQQEGSELSEDQLQQGGVPYNRDRFVVRRARLRVDGSWQYAALALELEGNTTRGGFFGLRRAEASLVWRHRDTARPPYALLTVGLTEVPFGYELVDSARRRVFAERSLGSQAFFPGQFDVGARLAGGLGAFRYALAVMNGTPSGDGAAGPAFAPTQAKDFVGRVGVDVTASPSVRFVAGASFLAGTGFHAGTDATRSGVSWRDTNENGAIDQGELTAVPGRAATPSLNFSRWALNVDAGLAVRTSLGWTRVYGEFTMATNLDRGVFVADPINAGADVRHLAFYAAIVQEVTRYGLVGLRFDYYDPNADLLDSRRGRLVPVNAAIETISPLVGVVLPDRARLVFQYDAILDALGRDVRGVPADLRNNQFTARLQVEF